MNPEHRPPTILGPYGEGYCRTCRFVIGLDEQGLLNAHRRGIASYGQASDCAGSGKAPPRLTPYASRAVAFKSAPRRVTCPDCGQQVALMPAGGTRLTLAGHLLPYSAGTYCPAGGS